MSGGCCLLGNLCLRRYCKARNCQISPRRLSGTPAIKEIRKQDLEDWNDVAKSQLINYNASNRQPYYYIHTAIHTRVLCARLQPHSMQAYFDEFNPLAAALQKKTLK